jgi:hypothetical protein
LALRLDAGIATKILDLAAGVGHHAIDHLLVECVLSAVRLSQHGGSEASATACASVCSLLRPSDIETATPLLCLLVQNAATAAQGLLFASTLIAATAGQADTTRAAIESADDGNEVPASASAPSLLSSLPSTPLNAIADTYALKLAMQALVRKLFSALLSSGISGSADLLPAALILLRSVATHARIVPLSDDEWNCAMQLLAAASAIIPTTMQHSTSRSQADLRVTHTFVADIDVGRCSSVPTVAGAGMALIAASAAALAPQIKDEQMATVQSNSPSSRPSLENTACWLVNSFIKYHRAVAINCFPLLGKTLQIIAVSLMRHARYLVPQNTPGQRAWRANMDAFSRACDQFARAAVAVRYNVVYLLAALLPAVVDLLTQSSSNPADIRAAVQPCIFALLQSCGSKELQQLHVALSRHPQARTLLKTFHTQFEDSSKYTGKA